MAASRDLRSQPGTAAVLARLTRPYDPVRVTALLLGLPQRAARHLVGSVLATCDEAEDLLDAMPTIVRSMAIATTDQPERCYGELRGPVLWSETMSARSASAGDPGLFVCSTTTKAYDTPENRVLKVALATIERAGRDATHGLESLTDDVQRRARHNEHRARHLLEHRTLSAVPVTRISGRTMRRTRGGSRRATYQPAVALLVRAAEPLRPHHLETYAPAATQADHRLLAAALAAQDARTASPAPLRTSHGALVSGPIRYEHLTGVTIGDARIGAPEQIDPALDRAG